MVDHIDTIKKINIFYRPACGGPGETPGTSRHPTSAARAPDGKRRAGTGGAATVQSWANCRHSVASRTAWQSQGRAARRSCLSALTSSGTVEGPSLAPVHAPDHRSHPERWTPRRPVAVGTELQAARSGEPPDHAGRPVETPGQRAECPVSPHAPHANLLAPHAADRRRALCATRHRRRPQGAAP